MQVIAENRVNSLSEYLTAIFDVTSGWKASYPDAKVWFRGQPKASY